MQKSVPGLKQEDLENFHKVVHRGFDDQEFDAQAAFFEYYDLPLPEVPLLDREFSRPLTLKLICESLRNLKGKKLAQGFAGIASGQKGMTYVLESFVNRVGKPIERQFGLRVKGCWGLLKGSDQIVGFASIMATKLRGYVLRSEADRIIATNYPGLRPAQRRQLLDVLRTDGLIEEDAIWYTSKSGGQVSGCISASLSTIQRPLGRTASAEDASRCFLRCSDQAKFQGQIAARAGFSDVKSTPPRVCGAGLGAGTDYRISGACWDATSTPAT